MAMDRRTVDQVFKILDLSLNTNYLTRFSSLTKFICHTRKYRHVLEIWAYIFTAFVLTHASLV